MSKDKMELLDKNACLSCDYYRNEDSGCEHDTGGFDHDDEGQFFCFYYEPRKPPNLGTVGGERG